MEIKQFQYKDYSEYVKKQIQGNLKKIDRVWTREKNIKFLSEYILSVISKPIFGICHGTRRGKEQEWFKKYLKRCKVIGTEISTNATEFPDTIRWDFHKIKLEWVGACDFVYTNSWDHAFNPEEAIKNWCLSLKDNGMLFLEYTGSHYHQRVNSTDPFQISVEDLRKAIKIWTNKNFVVKKILDLPSQRGKNFSKVLIIGKKRKLWMF